MTCRGTVQQMHVYTYRYTCLHWCCTSNIGGHRAILTINVIMTHYDCMSCSLMHTCSGAKTRAGKHQAACCLQCSQYLTAS